MELSVDQKKAIATAAARRRRSSAPPSVVDKVVGTTSQGLSGVNEGVANFLSLPNSIELGLRSIGPAIGNLMGGDFQMPTESLLPDAGANYRNAATEIGAIKPETDDPTGKFVRRVGQEVGANLLPVAAAPAKVVGALSTLGSGLGAATADLVAPDNQAAEFAGQMAGGFTPLGIANTIERNAMKLASPSVETLKRDAGALYDAAEARGVTFAQPAVKRASDEIAAQAISDGIDPTLHPGATAALKRVTDAGATGMTVKDAQTLRRVIAAAGKDPMNPDQARIASRMLEKFDDFVGPAAPELAQARSIYHQAKKGEMIEEAIELAQSKAGRYSQSGLENALRDEFRALERKIIKGQIKGLSDEEIAAIRKVAQGGPIENALRALGRFAPSGVVSFAASSGIPFAIGNAFLGPAGGAAAAGATMGTGLVSKALATRATQRNADVAAALMRRPPNAPPVPLVTPNSAKVAEALLLGQAANQNAPRRGVVDALIAPSSRASFR